MKRFLLTLILLVFLNGGVQAQQDAPALATLEVSLWPEFDRPEVLVIYRGMLAEDVPLPAPVEIRIPASAGEPTAVAYVDEAGQRFNQEHTTRVDGDWLVVSFELPTAGFQLEYYDALEVKENRRTYTLNLIADFAVADLSLDFQVPPTAQDFVLDPPADSVSQEADGLTYHMVHYGSVAQEEMLRWTIAYQKGDEDLTVALFTQPPTPTSPPAALPVTSGKKDGPVVWVWIAVLAALVVVGGGAFWLGRRTHPTPPPPRTKRRGGGRTGLGQPVPPPASNAGRVRYCYQCGAALRPQADFCHECGAAARTF